MDLDVLRSNVSAASEADPHANPVQFMPRVVLASLRQDLSSADGGPVITVGHILDCGMKSSDHRRLVGNRLPCPQDCQRDAVPVGAKLLAPRFQIFEQFFYLMVIHDRLIGLMVIYWLP